MRNYNINREPISSNEVSKFKDFKSILRKHSQTSEDLAKIKPVGSSNKIYWITGSVISALTFGALVMFNLKSHEPLRFVDQKVVKQIKDVELPKIEWQTVIRSPQNSIEDSIGVNFISANKIKYVKFQTSEDVKYLIKNIQKSDSKFVKNSIVFKQEKEVELKLSNKLALYSLSLKGQWVKVENNAQEMPYIEKPVLFKIGDQGIKLSFKNFDGPISKYKNVRWKPVNLKDLDDSYFTTEWEDASLEKTSINGVYTLTFKLGELEKSFNGYPALQKSTFDKAMIEYNKNLLRAQEKLNAAPKEYKISAGVYTIK